MVRILVQIEKTLNLTPPKKKNKKGILIVFLPAKKRANLARRAAHKKSSRKSRGGYFFVRLLRRFCLVRFFFNPATKKEKNWTHSDLSLSHTHNHLVSSHHLRFALRCCDTKLSVCDPHRKHTRTRENEKLDTNR